MNTSKRFWQMIFAVMGAVFISAALSACGGAGCSDVNCGSTSGSGGSTGGSSSSSANTVVVTITNTGGSADNALTSANSLTVNATVRNAAGNLATNEVVTFSLSNSLATLSPTSATALTDANGVARISLKSSNSGAGAGSVTAKTTLAGTSTEISGAANFSVGAASSTTLIPNSINFTAAIPTDKSIVIKGSGGLGRTEVAMLTFQVMDSTSTAVPGATVNFTTSTSAATLVAASGVTDTEGKVTAVINSGTIPGTVVVTATVNGTSISANSGVISVVTGPPVQSHFSLSLSHYNMEGYDYDNTKIDVLALLADINGDVVTGNIAVVFTTDAGAVTGPNGDAMCTTNSSGECSVTLRSQNPRLTIGTITATADNGNITDSKQFYMSGSYGSVVFQPGSAATMDFTLSCNTQVLSFRATDENAAPMPYGTTISVVNASTGTTANIDDGTVASVAPPNADKVRNIDVTPPTECNTSGTATKAGSFYINIKTPKGVQTLQRINYSYKA